MEKQFFVRTNEHGISVPQSNKEHIVFMGEADKQLNLEPNTDYVTTINVDKIPEGYRVVTCEEKMKCLKPVTAKLYVHGSLSWKNTVLNNGAFNNNYLYIVPKDTVLESKFKPVKEKCLTVDGKEVSESTIIAALKAYFK